MIHNGTHHKCYSYSSTCYKNTSTQVHNNKHLTASSVPIKLLWNVILSILNTPVISKQNSKTRMYTHTHTHTHTNSHQHFILSTSLLDINLSENVTNNIIKCNQSHFKYQPCCAPITLSLLASSTLMIINSSSSSRCLNPI